MFDSLKKKLKAAIEKVSKSVKEEKIKEEPQVQETKHVELEIVEVKEEIREHEEKLKDYIEEEEKREIPEPLEEKKEEVKIETKIDEIEERKQEIREYIEEIKKDEIPEIKEEIKQEIKIEERKHTIEVKKIRPEINIEEKKEIQEIKSEIKVEEIEEVKEEIIEEPKEEKKEKRGFFSRIFKKEKPTIKIEKEEIRPEIKPETKHVEPEIIKIKEKPKEEEKKEEKRSLFEKVVKKVVEKKLSEEEIEKILKELRIVLMENDVAFETVEKITSDLKNDLIGQEVKRGSVETTITDSLRKSILDCMQQPKVEIEKMIEDKYEKTKEPLLIVFCGFNGTGKTTSIAKLAHKLKKYNPILAAGDTFRAASIEQLEEHGRRIDVKVVKHKYGSDSAAVIFDAVKHAKSIGSKVVLADTAGRSHSNVNLMDELKKVIRVNKPDMKILVLDSITGNDIYDQAKLFNDAVQVDGIIMTKADVYEKGAALSASHTIKKPILYLGVGQNYSDLKEFNPEEIVNNLLG